MSEPTTDTKSAPLSAGIVFKKIAEVGKSLKAVKMSNMQRYKARHIYDVYNMMQPVLAEHGLVIGRDLLDDKTTQVESAKGTKGTHRYQVWRFKIIAEDGSSVETTFPCESVDWGDKSASQCDAMAFKQMLIHTFLIPTEDMKEPDDKGKGETDMKFAPDTKSSQLKPKKGEMWKDRKFQRG